MEKKWNKSMFFNRENLDLLLNTNTLSDYARDWENSINCWSELDIRSPEHRVWVRTPIASSAAERIGSRSETTGSCQFGDEIFVVVVDIVFIFVNVFVKAKWRPGASEMGWMNEDLLVSLHCKLSALNYKSSVHPPTSLLNIHPGDLALRQSTHLHCIYL